MRQYPLNGHGCVPKDPVDIRWWAQPGLRTVCGPLCWVCVVFLCVKFISGIWENPEIKPLI